MALTPQLVMANVRRLEALFRELGTLSAPLAEARAQQGPGKWSAIPECTQFGQYYAQNLDALAHNLDLLSADIGVAAQNLLDNAQAMEQIDGAARERLMTIVRSAEASAPVPTTVSTPYDIPAGQDDLYSAPEPEVATAAEDVRVSFGRTS
ncbi:barstar family protein [Actinotalea sp. C106]|uniref:barstar family protein n=1 Tax=Actinotalea sp. C106 TaxID=2908644 RepID=UPI002028124B|nr:barstar family protein [Actinotalea sp. C106]